MAATALTSKPPWIHSSSSSSTATQNGTRCWCSRSTWMNKKGRGAAGGFAYAAYDPLKPASSPTAVPRARLVARRSEIAPVQQLQRSLLEYMGLPASQYSVLDAERIERVDEDTFRCFVYRFKFFAFEVCPVLLVRVEQQPNGCCIRLISCKLEGSPIVVAQNDKFSASMVNKISCQTGIGNSSVQQLKSDTAIEVIIDIPFAFRAIPVELIESTGNQVLEQILKIMLPRFLIQHPCWKNCRRTRRGGIVGVSFVMYRISNHFPLVKDYKAWASGDGSRKPLGTGEI